MKIYRSVLFALLCCGHLVVSAQLKEYLTAACEPLDYNYLMDQLENFPKNDTSKLHFEHRKVFRRQITPTFDELIISVRYSQMPGWWGFDDDHKIQIILSQENKIAFCTVQMPSKSEITHRKTYFADSTYLLTNVKDEFHSLFNQKLTLDELFETEIVFGDYCSASGQPPLYKFLTEDLIANEDVWILKDWLASGTTEIQLYAVYGLKTLQNQGLALDTDTEKQIDFICSKKGEVNFCSGCFFTCLELKSINIMNLSR